MDSKAVKFTVIPLSKLKAHPRQHDAYFDLDERMLGKLVEDIRVNGQISPIEVLPDGTIVDGHQRYRALSTLGASDAKVMVRHDLVGSAELALDRLIEANLSRRQVTLVERMRGIALRSNSTKGDLSAREKREIATELEVSPKTVQRLLNVVELPPAIQRAVSREEIPLVVGCRLKHLSTRVLLGLEKMIAAGGDARNLVSEALHRDGKKSRLSRDPVMELLSLASKMLAATKRLAHGEHFEGQHLVDMSTAALQLRNAIDLLGCAIAKSGEDAGPENGDRATVASQHEVARAGLHQAQTHPVRPSNLPALLAQLQSKRPSKPQSQTLKRRR